MKTLKITLIILLFILLTILSQVGGIILLIWLLIYRSFNEKIKNIWIRKTSNILGFIAFYMIFNLLIIPPLARLDGKVPLPLSKSGDLVPVTYWTAIFMRNYISVKGKESLETISAQFAQKHPGIKVKYMDCNYPFCFDVKGKKNVWILEGLVPHLSHKGDKADIAFVYNDDNGNPSNLTPTAIGYGSCVDPKKNEPQIPCDSWMYSFMYRNMPNSGYELNNIISAQLVKMFRKYTYDKILIEKHLKVRFNLRGRFGIAGCNSVRHDDHFHVNLGE
jgi:hypothetical protein